MDPDSKEVYRMKSSPRGLMVIVNIENFPKDWKPFPTFLTPREGSEKDVEELKYLFSRYLDFEVLVFKDQTCHQLLKELSDISENPDNARYDCLAVCIMTHGEDDFFYAADGYEINIQHVFAMFTNTQCKAFHQKPKLFFIQACRGSVRHPDMSDILIFYSGYPPYRNTKTGSYFIQILVKVFKQYADKENISELLSRVIREHRVVHDADGITSPTTINLLKKKLYFYPVVKFDYHDKERAGKTSSKKSLLGLPFNPEEQSTVERTDHTHIVSDFGDNIARMITDDPKQVKEDKEVKQADKIGGIVQDESGSTSQVQQQDLVDSNEVYRMKSSPRGLMVIVNMENFSKKSKLSQRNGSANDVTQLADVFSDYLDFKVLICLDKARDQLLKDLSDISKDPDNAIYDCLAVCIMTHGKRNAFYAADGRKIKVQQVLTMFTNTQCDVFRQKPKLFFIQACRGSLGEGFDTDLNVSCFARFSRLSHGQGQADSKDPDMSDMLIAYPSYEGYTSYRHEQTGTLFIQSLVRVFRDYADKEHIAELITRVIGEVYNAIHGKEGRTQVPSPTFTLKKKLYFWPRIKFDD